MTRITIPKEQAEDMIMHKHYYYLPAYYPHVNPIYQKARIIREAHARCIDPFNSPAPNSNLSPTAQDLDHVTCFYCLTVMVSQDLNEQLRDRARSAWTKAAIMFPDIATTMKEQQL